MKKISKKIQHLWKDESAQGVSEYILLLVVVIAVAFIFKDQIKQIVTTKMGELGTSIGDFGK